MNPIISFKTIYKILILIVFFLKVKAAEVQKLLNNVNTRKASNIYGISTKPVKHSSEHTKECVLQIFTVPFCEGTVLDKLKSE